MVVCAKVPVVDSIELKAQMANSGYTNEWVLDMLRDHNAKFMNVLGNSKVENVTAKDVSETKGYLSRVYRVLVEFDNQKEYSFIMKVPTMDCLDEVFKTMGIDGEGKNQMVNELKNAHNKECDAYKLIADVKNFPKVETFYVEYISEERPGVIVMEDLTKKATTIGFFRTVTQQQCLNFARHFGNFQAQLNHRAEEWRGKYPDSFHTSKTNREEVPKFMNKLVEIKKELADPVKRVLSIDVTEYNVYALKEVPNKYNATTLCHGDAWSNNIMMRVAEDGSVMDEFAAIIDWQIIFEGNPYHDLARFMIVCADADVRRACEQEAVNLQYDNFVETTQKLGDKVSYTREQAHELYDLAAIQQCYELVGITAFVKMNNVEKVSEEILEAQVEKCAMKTKFGLDDVFKLMDKYGIDEKFPKKQ